MAKMTSGEIGAKIGRSESYVSLLRRGKRTPSVDRLLVIVEVFGLKWEDVGPKLEQGPGVFGPWLDEVAFTVPEPPKDEAKDQAKDQPQDEAAHDQEPPAGSGS